MQMEFASISSLASPRATCYRRCDVLVLDAALRQSLVTVRSLGSRGVRVAALETADRVPAFSSRWCHQKVICPADEGTEEYLAYLEQALDSTGVRVLITSSDGTVALLRRYRRQLEQGVRIALAKESALAMAINKEQTLEIAKRVGMAIPRGVHVGSVDDVEAALREIGLPAVVKPVESWVYGGQHGVRFEPQLVTTPQEACQVIEELTGLGGRVLFQQFLPGRREAIHVLYAQGHLYACFAQWAKRTYPPLGGTSIVRQSIPIPPDIGKQAERLVREIELEGYAEVEFRRDGAGKPYLMEINPRLSASVELAVRAGVDFPYLLYQWANGETINVVKSYRVGGWMRHLGGDVATTVVALQQRDKPGVQPPVQTIFDFFTAFFVPMSYDYLDWKDPLPAWTATVDFARRLVQWIGRGLSISKRQLLAKRNVTDAGAAQALQVKKGETAHV